MSDNPRFLSFIHHGRRGYGLAIGAGVVDLSSRHGSQWPGLRHVIEGGNLARLSDAASAVAPDFPLADVQFDLPLPDPEKIICVGVNYPDRNAEYKDGEAAPPYPSLFIRFPRSFVGHEAALVRPKASPQLDYEGEIVLVIGKAGRHIAKTKALDHIAALSMCNEGTIRDWVRHAKFNVTQGKNFDCTGAMGPWLVPFVNRNQIDDIRLTTRVNGGLRQDERTNRMIFDVPSLIAYISTFTTLVPGDVIVTGTPTGAGARLDPPVFLIPGDVIEIEAEGLGILRNGVVDEQ